MPTPRRRLLSCRAHPAQTCQCYKAQYPQPAQERIIADVYKWLAWKYMRQFHGGIKQLPESPLLRKRLRLITPTVHFTAVRLLLVDAYRRHRCRQAAAARQTASSRALGITQQTVPRAAHCTGAVNSSGSESIATIRWQAGSQQAGSQPASQRWLVAQRWLAALKTWLVSRPGGCRLLQLPWTQTHGELPGAGCSDRRGCLCWPAETCCVPWF